MSTLSRSGLQENTMQTLSMSQARRQWTRLLKRVEKGERFVILLCGKPAALLASPSFAPVPQRFRLGCMVGEITIQEDFDAALPDEVLADFYTER